MDHLQPDDDLFDVAANWIVKLRSPQASDRDRLEFSRWLNTDKANQIAFDEMLGTWETMALGAELPAASWDPKAQQHAPLNQFKQWLTQLLPGPRNLRLWLASAATCTAALLVAFAFLLDTTSPPQEEFYQTAAGESYQVQLDDGSTVVLNTRTKIEVVYSEQQRLIRLLNGEAYFEVASNKQRPFVVDVGRGTVTAVGTAFNIKRAGNRDEVTVTEGVVRVKQNKDAATPYPESKFVNAEQELTLSGQGLSQAVPSQHQVHWLHRTLNFDGTSLAEALTELNRYLPNPVLFDPSNFRDLKISGTFSTEAPAETLQAIITSFNLQLDANNTLKHTEVANSITQRS